MKKKKDNFHPYHYFEDKNFFQRVIDIGIPLGLFWVYFQFYNFGKITPHEMIKTTGLLAIALLSLTLLIGPACRFFPFLNILKAHRKSWGISAFLAAATHTILIFVHYYKFNLLKFVDFQNPKYLGILAGLIALAILLVVTLTSNKKALKALSPNTWKVIQTTSYIALLLAVVHFYIVESTNGVLVIKRLFGQITFGFAAFVAVFRLIFQFLPSKKSK